MDNKSQRFLIAIDDTDNLESRGTGWRSRQLAKGLEENCNAKAISVTRHQLFVHKDIPYTSHNSSACIEVEASNKQDLINFSREFLLKESADGSDAGLCVIEKDLVHPEIELWGKRAKIEVITMQEAYYLANLHGLYLEGLTGEKTGIIGALAGVGLHHEGNDGRFLLLGSTDLRNFNGIISIENLKKMYDISEFRIRESNIFANEKDTIFINNWMRPIMLNKKAVLIIEPSFTDDYNWKVADKEYIKMISS